MVVIRVSEMVGDVVVIRVSEMVGDVVLIRVSEMVGDVVVIRVSEMVGDVVVIRVSEIVGDVVVTSAVVFIGVLEFVITGDVVVTDGCCHWCIGCCHRWWCCYRIIDNTYHNIYHYLPLKTNDFQHVGDIKFNYKVLSDMSESIKMLNLACHKKCIDNPIRLIDDEAILIFKFMVPYKIVSCIKLLTCGR